MVKTQTINFFGQVESIITPSNPLDYPTNTVPRDDYQYPEQIGCIILMGFYVFLIILSLYNMVLSIIAKRITNSFKLLFINFLIGVHALSIFSVEKPFFKILVSFIFFGDGLLKMKGMTAFGDKTFIFIAFLSCIMQNLVMIVASYYWFDKKISFN